MQSSQEPQSKRYTPEGDLILSGGMVLTKDGEAIDYSKHILELEIQELLSAHGIEADPEVVSQILEELAGRVTNEIMNDIGFEDDVLETAGKIKNEVKIERRQAMRMTLKKRLTQLGLAVLLAIPVVAVGKGAVDSLNQPHIPTRAELAQQDADQREQERKSIESQLSEKVGKRFLAWGARPDVALEMQELLSPDGSDYQLSSEAPSDIRLKAEFARNFYEYMKTNGGRFDEMRQKYVTEHPEYKYVFFGNESQNVADILAVPGVNLALANELVFRTNIMWGKSKVSPEDNDASAVAYRVTVSLLNGENAFSKDRLTQTMQNEYRVIHGQMFSDEMIPNIYDYIGIPKPPIDNLSSQ